MQNLLHKLGLHTIELIKNKVIIFKQGEQIGAITL